MQFELNVLITFCYLFLSLTELYLDPQPDLDLCVKATHIKPEV